VKIGDSVTLFCPFDGQEVAIEAPTAPGYLIVVHERDTSKKQCVFDAYFAVEVEV